MVAAGRNTYYHRKAQGSAARKPASSPAHSVSRPPACSSWRAHTPPSETGSPGRRQRCRVSMGRCASTCHKPWKSSSSSSWVWTRKQNRKQGKKQKVEHGRSGMSLPAGIRPFTKYHIFNALKVSQLGTYWSGACFAWCMAGKAKCMMHGWWCYCDYDGRANHHFSHTVKTQASRDAPS